MREEGFEPSQALSQQLSPKSARVLMRQNSLSQTSSPKAAPFDRSGIPSYKKEKNFV